MNQIGEAVKMIGLTSGRNDKIALLKKYADLPGFKETLQFIYNPYVVTGIAKTKLLKGKHNNPLVNPSLAEVIKYFTEHQTGADNDVYFAWGFINAQATDPGKNIAIALVTKDLTIGITDKTLNQVYGKDFIPKIGVMLAEKYPEFKDKVKGPYITTEKLDGHRRLLIKENGVVSIYTRSGLPDSGLVDIEEEAKYLPDNTAYDGECLAKGTFPDSIALRQATSSIMNSHGVRHGVNFNMFDMVPLDEFKRGHSEDNAFARKIAVACTLGDKSVAKLLAFNWKETYHREPTESELNDYLNNCMSAFKTTDHVFEHIKPVEILGIAYNEEDAINFALPIWARKYEGVMLNTLDGLYEIKRTNQLLKVKHTEEMVLPIVDFIEGEGKYAGMLGAFVLDYKGHRVGIGSGLTDAQRVFYWNNRSSLIGTPVEVDTFGESTNKDGGISLNCPIFKRLAGEVD